MRLSYTPAHGAHALTRKAGALPSDVEKQVEELGNDAAYSQNLRDKDIGLEGAERSCLAQLEKIQRQKAAHARDKKPGTTPTKTSAATSSETPPTTKATPISLIDPPKTPIVYNLEEQDHSMIPGRKGRKTQSAEELEAEQRDGEWHVPQPRVFAPPE